MTPPASNPRLFPEPVPGGSLIGSVNSRFAATFTLYQSHNPSENGQIPDVPSYETFNSDYQPDPSQSDSRDDKDVKNMIQNLSREKIEALVTQAWIRNIPNQSEDKLRELVAGAVKKGILTPDDIQISCVDSFTCLPTQIQLRIVSYLPLRTRIIFLTAVNSQLTRLAHYPQLWLNIDLEMPFQSTLKPLGDFLMKYTPSKSIERLHFPSSTRSYEFVKFLVTLKRLKSELKHVHLTGKQVTGTTLAALESLLGKWTETLILEFPCPKVDVISIVSLISNAPRLTTFAIQTCVNFSNGQHDTFLQKLWRAGETTRIHHRHPEINARLRCLQMSCTSTQTVKFSTVAELGKFFPLLEMLRIENWKIIPDGDRDLQVQPMFGLRGLSLVGIDFSGRKDKDFVNMLSKFIAAFRNLEMLFLGAKETIAMWGWTWFGPKPVGLQGLFDGMQLPDLQVLWLRGWTLDCADLLSLKSDKLRFVVIEECKGMNGGWIKAVMGKWKGAVVVESETRLKDGVDFSSWRGLAEGKIG